MTPPGRPSGDASGPPARGWLAYDTDGDFDSEALGLAVLNLPSTNVR